MAYVLLVFMGADLVFTYMNSYFIRVPVYSTITDGFYWIKVLIVCVVLVVGLMLSVTASPYLTMLGGWSILSMGVFNRDKFEGWWLDGKSD